MANDDLGTFVRRITRRNEMVWREVIGELREMRAQSREHTAELRELTAEIRDMRDETRAQRDGLFKLIDEIRRLGEGPGPASA